MKKIIGMIVILAALPGLANANEKGNGGNAMVCFDSESIVNTILSEQQQLCPECQTGPVKLIPQKYIQNVVSVEAVDLVEAKQRMVNGQKAQMHEFLANETVEQYTDRLVRKFAGFYPEVQATYEAGKLKIGNRIRSIDVGMIRTAQDINPVQLASPTCLYATVYYQVKLDSRRSELSVYTPLTDKRFFTKLNEAVFRLHETFLAVQDDASVTTDLLRSFIGNLVRNAPLTGEELLLSYQAAQLPPIKVNDFFQPHKKMGVVMNSSIASIHQAVRDAIIAKAPPIRAKIVEGFPKWFRKHGAILVTTSPYQWDTRFGYGITAPWAPYFENWHCAEWWQTAFLSRVSSIWTKKCLNTEDAAELQVRLAAAKVERTKVGVLARQEKWREVQPQMKKAFEEFLASDFSDVPDVRKAQMIERAKAVLADENETQLAPIVEEHFHSEKDVLFNVKQ